MVLLVGGGCGERGVLFKRFGNIELFMLREKGLFICGGFMIEGC